MSITRELGRTVGRYFVTRKIRSQERREMTYSKELIELETKRLELAKAEVELKRALIEKTKKPDNEQGS
jgi:hypothetical protein